MAEPSHKGVGIIVYISRLLYLAASLFGVILMILMILTLFAGVFSRYVLNEPIFWTDEFARIVLMWSIFIGAGLSFKRGSTIDHIHIDFFVSMLPPRYKGVSQKITWSICIFFCIVLLIIGIRFLFLTTSLQTAALEISKGFIYISLPVFSLMALGFLIERWFSD
jgi:TRAP-type C4-dicarboxylate transport system permease small subunit